METTIMKNKTALIIGGRGMVGRQIVELCSKVYDKVCVVDVDFNIPQDLPDNVDYKPCDMTFKTNTNIIADYNHVYHLAGIKGSPLRAKEKPADYLPMVQFDTNVIQAVGHWKPDWFLYTSSIGVYPPSEYYKEDDVWNKVPSENDKVPAYIKRMGELSCYAIRATYGYENISIVRPANIYGPYDNFGDESTVIASLISKGYHNDIINVWGDGSPIRDFIYSKDVARGMLHMVENKVTETVNLGSGKETRISDIANTIGEYFDKEVKYDKSKPNGDMRRQMDTSRAESVGFKPNYTLEDGITETIEWYSNER
jgi:GDP-L-fucose synthase|tara:strand:+ start:21 stop:956 length:936 start_codon:yes stop_codon:yes gene_type:complete